MAFQPQHWLDIVQALAQPKQRHSNDQSTLRDFNWSRFDNKLPDGLSLQWLGTAGFAFEYQGYTLLVDPYFTRPSMRRTLNRKGISAKRDTIETYLSAADAVLCGHTHFDHALDIPEITKLFDCEVYGSGSLKNLMGLHGLGDKAHVVECKKTYELGPFEVTFIESIHSKLVFGLTVPSEGELCCEHLENLNAGQFRCGQVYGIHIKVAGISFYHQGSANLIDDNVIHRDVDYFLAGISGRSFTKNYTSRILKRLSPQVVIPHHFDNFFEDIDQPMTFSLNVNLGKFVEEVESVSKEFEIRTLDLLQKI